MSIFTDLATTKTLQDYCDTRDAAIEDYKAAIQCMDRAKESLESIGRYLYPVESRYEVSLEKFIKHLDRGLWRLAFDKTGLRQFMDHKAKQDFDKSLDTRPPEFTMDNCRSVLLSAASDAEMMFNRGLVEVFRSFSSDHKTNTNEPFKINRKCIMSYMVSRWLGYSQIRYGNYSSDKVNDLDRVMKTLDDKKHNSRELESLINAAFKKGEIFEDDYYRIKGFKNGNMHIEFKREDLLEKANMIIARWYGENKLSA